MDRIRPHLGLARNVRVSNVWVLATPGGERFLVDTGHVVERGALRYHLWRAGIRGPGDLTGVILTHRHSDHAGNAAWLRRVFDAPIICHADDAPYLTGSAQAPPLASPETALWARVLCHIEDRFPARTTVDEVLEDGEDARWGFRVFHAPGHTDGSMLLHHEPTRTLFTGDTIIGGPPPLRFLERLRLSFDEFSDDGGRARASVRELVAQLPRTDTMCSGHGPPVFDEVDRKLRELYRRDVLRPRLSVPSRRRR